MNNIKDNHIILQWVFYDIPGRYFSTYAIFNAILFSYKTEVINIHASMPTEDITFSENCILLQLSRKKLD